MWGPGAQPGGLAGEAWFSTSREGGSNCRRPGPLSRASLSPLCPAGVPTCRVPWLNPPWSPLPWIKAHPDLPTRPSLGSGSWDLAQPPGIRLACGSLLRGPKCSGAVTQPAGPCTCGSSHLEPFFQTPSGFISSCRSQLLSCPQESPQTLTGLD